MSIINRMLSDLDARLESQPSNSKVTLEGLSAADGVLSRRSKPPYRVLTLIGLVLLLSLLILTGGSRVASKTIDSAPLTSPMKSLERVSSIPVLEIGSQLPGRVERGEPGLFAEANDPVLAAGAQTSTNLKLALWLGNPPTTGTGENAFADSIRNIPGAPTLEVIRLSSHRADASIALRLSGNPGYLLYTLADPPRAVVELERTLLVTELPAPGADLPLLAGVRSRQLPDGSLRIIFDLVQPADIHSTDMVSEDGFKELVINLTPNYTPIVQERRPPDEAVVSELPEDAGLRVAATTPATSELVGKAEAESETTFTKVASKTADEYFQQALAFSESGRLQRAERALVAALTANPGHADARVTLVSSLVQQNRTHDGLVVLRDGLAITPTEPKLASLYARLLVRLGKLEVALEILKNAAPPLSRDPAYHAFIAAVSQRLGAHRAAAETYEHVLEHEPENGVWWMGMAISLEALNEGARAMKAYQRALEAESLTHDLQRYVGQRLTVLKQQRNS